MVGRLRVVDFVVGEMLLSAVALQLMAYEGLLLQVFSFVFILVHPEVGIHLAYLLWHQASKDGVAGILCGRRENAEIKVLLDVKLLGEFTAQGPPLVET